MLPAPASNPTIDSVYSLRRTILEQAQSSPKEVKQKVEWLKTLTGRVEELRRQCQELTEDTDHKVQDLPFWRIRKYTDRLGFGFFDFLNGKIGKARMCVRRSLQDVEACIQTISKRELLAGYTPEEQSLPSFGVDIVHYFNMINRLHPNDPLCQTKLASHLLSEGAYMTAHATYKTFCEQNPGLARTVKLDMIRALMSAGNFEKALEEILDAKNELFPPDAPKDAFKTERATLDLKKATCLIELKRYDEAREVLLQQFGEQGASHEALAQLFLISLGEATADLSLVERAKQMFAQLPHNTKKSVAWSKDCLIFTFEFWLHSACCNLIKENQAFYTQSLESIDAFIQSKAVTPKVLLESLLNRAKLEETRANNFLKAYHNFAKVTQQPIPEASTPVIDGRKEALYVQLFGAKQAFSPSGILTNLDTLKIILKKCQNSKLFEDAESTQTMQQITDLLELTKHNLDTAVKSLVATVQAGKHPYINVQSLPFVANLMIGQ